MPTCCRPREQSQVQGFLLQLANHNCEQMERLIEGPRIEGRLRLMVVAIVIPFVRKRPVMERMFVAVTKELSATGLSLVFDSPRALDEVLLGFRWGPYTKFVRATTKHRSPLGAGFFQVGLKVLNLINEKKYPELQDIWF